MGLSEQIQALPHSPGVYRFRDHGGRVVYLGRAASLRSRVGSYFAPASFSRSGDRRHLRRMVPQVARIEAVVTASAHEAAWLERNLHERSLPRWNRIRGGAEVPQVIRVLDGLRGASVAVEHLTGRRDEPADPAYVRVFGPYLGGLRVRTAVTGLARVWPVAFAGPGLTGSERDLAAVRGISSADRVRLLDGLVATLRGDPAAVAYTVAELTRRRAAAAEAQSYEFAARVHEEIAAVEWVVQRQRVAGLDRSGRSDAVLTGWSDGLLVSWTVRAGRMDGWTQRVCGAAAAQPHLDRTAPVWAEFAATNAELAGRLHRLI